MRPGCSAARWPCGVECRRSPELSRTHVRRRASGCTVRSRRAGTFRRLLDTRLVDFIVNELLAPVLAAALIAAPQCIRRPRRSQDEHAPGAEPPRGLAPRWIRDRDRVRTVELNRIVNEMSAQGLTDRGALLRARAAQSRIALQEYRDEATRKLRELDELADSEGPAHRLWRRCKGLPRLGLGMSDDCRWILQTWRAPATNPADLTATAPVEDPSRAPLGGSREDTGVRRVRRERPGAWRRRANSDAPRTPTGEIRRLPFGVFTEREAAVIETCTMCARGALVDEHGRCERCVPPLASATGRARRLLAPAVVKLIAASRPCCSA
jgi:hypothetical protein